MSEPSKWFADELLRRLFFQPGSVPPELALRGPCGANGHGGPGHQDASSDECGTLPGMVCFMGAFVHIGNAIYRVGRYHRERNEWEAHWPD